VQLSGIILITVKLNTLPAFISTERSRVVKMSQEQIELPSFEDIVQLDKRRHLINTESNLNRVDSFDLADMLEADLGNVQSFFGFMLEKGKQYFIDNIPLDSIKEMPFKCSYDTHIISYDLSLIVYIYGARHDCFWHFGVRVRIGSFYFLCVR
jgi:hypothetical protein